MNKEEQELKEEITNTLEVKRLLELERYIDTNETIKSEFAELKLIQQKMVQAKALDNFTAYNDYNNAYKVKMKNLLEAPFMEEYFELLEEVHGLLKIVSQTIESEINKKLL